MNPMKLMQIKPMLDTFNATHPKVMPFIRAVSENGIKEDSIIEISVTTPEGKKFDTNIKVRQSDLDLVEALKNINN